MGTIGLSKFRVVNLQKKVDNPKCMDIQSSLKTPNWNDSFCLKDGFMCCLHCKQLLEFGAPNTRWGQQGSTWSNIGLQDSCYWAIPEEPNTVSQIVTRVLSENLWYCLMFWLSTVFQQWGCFVAKGYCPRCWCKACASQLFRFIGENKIGTLIEVWQPDAAIIARKNKLRVSRSSSVKRGGCSLYAVGTCNCVRWLRPCGISPSQAGVFYSSPGVWCGCWC